MKWSLVGGISFIRSLSLERPTPHKDGLSTEKAGMISTLLASKYSPVYVLTGCKFAPVHGDVVQPGSLAYGRSASSSCTHRPLSSITLPRCCTLGRCVSTGRGFPWTTIWPFSGSSEPLMRWASSAALATVFGEYYLGVATQIYTTDATIATLISWKHRTRVSGVDHVAHVTLVRC